MDTPLVNGKAYPVLHVSAATKAFLELGSPEAPTKTTTTRTFSFDSEVGVRVVSLVSSGN